MGSVAKRVDLVAETSVEARMGFKAVGFAKRLKWVWSKAGLVKRDA